MASFVASKTVQLMIEKDHHIKGANVLIMGVTFKENCPDVRNTKVADIYKELRKYGVEVDVYDSWADALEVSAEYDIDILNEEPTKKYEAVIVAVAHKQFLKLDLKQLMKPNAVVFDTKACLDRELVDSRL